MTHGWTYTTHELEDLADLEKICIEVFLSCQENVRVYSGSLAVFL